MTLAEQVESLQTIIENMATTHVTWAVKGSRNRCHPDWCPLCRLERAERIGSPAAIADWVAEVIVPELGVKMNLPEKSVKRGVVLTGCSAGDLWLAIREHQVLP